MANTTLSPVMNMPVPVPGTDPGPQYAFDLNSCLNILDQHDHTPGAGNPITPSAISINSDLSFGSHNILALLGAQFTPQVPATSLLGALSVSGVDLWYTDGSGNKIQITASGGVAGTPGSIANLVPPASASYVSGSKTFVFQSNVSDAANIDGASYILRNIPGTFGLTLAPPTLGSNYTITLPTLPSVPSFLSIDSSGGMGDSIPLAGGLSGSNIAAGTITGGIGGNLASATITELNMAALSVGTPELIANSVTPAKLSAPVATSASGSGTVNSTSFQDICSTTITVSGLRPVLIIVNTGSTLGYFSIQDNSNPPVGTAAINLVGTGDIVVTEVATDVVGEILVIPISLMTVDFPTAGAKTYKLRCKVNSSPTTNFIIQNAVITALEL